MSTVSRLGAMNAVIGSVRELAETRKDVVDSDQRIAALETIFVCVEWDRMANFILSKGLVDEYEKELEKRVAQLEKA